jgi:putative Ca2+/H+ antiporter (TMEM165/GDT1 family)
MAGVRHSQWFNDPAWELFMEAFLVSSGIVALAEIGDKTQLLAFLLAAKFRKPLPIVLGILVATLVNHGLAGALGAAIPGLLDPATLRWILGVSFLGMAVWILVPDKIDDGDTPLARYGAFTTTVIAFFLAEMGDKTQIATIALAAQYQAWLAVVAGTTIGMLLANAPAVYLGEKLAQRLPVKLVHRIAAAIFAVLGILTLFGAGKHLGL